MNEYTDFKDSQLRIKAQNSVICYSSGRHPKYNSIFKVKMKIQKKTHETNNKWLSKQTKKKLRKKHT